MGHFCVRACACACAYSAALAWWISPSGACSGSSIVPYTGSSVFSYVASPYMSSNSASGSVNSPSDMVAVAVAVATLMVNAAVNLMRAISKPQGRK